MNDKDFFFKLFVEILNGSPSLFALIAFGALLLKKYVINGSIKAYLDIKRQELASLSTIEKSLVGIVDRQEEMYAEFLRSISS